MEALGQIVRVRAWAASGGSRPGFSLLTRVARINLLACFRHTANITRGADDHQLRTAFAASAYLEAQRALSTREPAASMPRLVELPSFNLRTAINLNPQSNSLVVVVDTHTYTQSDSNRGGGEMSTAVDE